MLIETVHSPADIKGFDTAQLTALAAEIRSGLMNRLSKRGGHFGPNFGIVEATVALHYVFDSPKDKFVFDVSHQCYTHKILTGRKDAFFDDAHFGDVSGYTNPEESEHDFFNVGHTSTSVSLACGLAKSRDLKGESGNVIAIIGDGSLSGGEALEGLGHCHLADLFAVVASGFFPDLVTGLIQNVVGFCLCQDFLLAHPCAGEEDSDGCTLCAFDAFRVVMGDCRDDFRQFLCLLFSLCNPSDRADTHGGAVSAAVVRLRV